MQLLSISMILCSAVAVCNFSNACEMSDCEFNPANPTHAATVTTIISPDKSAWRSMNQLDDVDSLLFDNKSIPHNFMDIDQAPRGSVYVVKKDYMQTCTIAKQNLEKKQEMIKQKSATSFEASGQVSSDEEHYKKLWLEQNLLMRAKSRLKEYQKILNAGTSYRHLCTGFIVPQKTALCVKQWAFLQQD